ncbi:hypothetical protein [Streptomyces tendae]|uniref:hypothetical protein n=1 Tax=Streptomyces tendae TaxID=1932 RepID=UPI00364FF97B
MFPASDTSNDDRAGSHWISAATCGQNTTLELPEEQTEMRYTDPARALLRPLNSTSHETRSTTTHQKGNYGRVTSTSAAALALQDHAALWSMGEIPAADVVAGACDALLAGLDSPALRMLAACTRTEADYDVPDLLPPAVDELGLTFYPAGSVAGQEAAVRALAARMLVGELTPRELVFRIHQRFGHELPLAEELANLDDEYDVVEYGGRTSAQVDADVAEEALRLTRHPALHPNARSTDLKHTGGPSGSHGRDLGFRESPNLRLDDGHVILMVSGTERDDRSAARWGS